MSSLQTFTRLSHSTTCQNDAQSLLTVPDIYNSNLGRQISHTEKQAISRTFDTSMPLGLTTGKQLLQTTLCFINPIPELVVEITQF